MGEGAARDVARETLDREHELLGDLGQEALIKAGVLDEKAENREPLGVPRPIGLS